MARGRYVEAQVLLPFSPQTLKAHQNFKNILEMILEESNCSFVLKIDDGLV